MIFARSEARAEMTESIVGAAMARVATVMAHPV
jgi:hypothetical protein